MDRVSVAHGLGIFCMAVGVVVFFGGIWLSAEKELSWRIFTNNMDCKVFSQIDDVYVPLIMNGSVTMMLIPGKTGYRCADGVEHWR